MIYSLLFFLNLSFAEHTPVKFSDFKIELNEENAVAWESPNYSGQDKALGYETGAFAIPPGMEAKVSFWLDIYTKFNTNQGLLHDSRYVHIVYESVDFKDETDVRARRKMVDDAKKRIVARLEKLSRYQSSAGLEGEDLRYWYLFNNVDERNKFIAASKEGRLRFQLGQRDRFIKGIFFSGRYLAKMEQIFRDQGLPVELTRLPFVESSFNFKAKSRVGASGIWQFMRGTARPFLKMNAYVDERNDPIKSTEAAAKQLRINYNLLNNWPLAVTGYNHGPYGIRRLVKKYNTDDLTEIMSIRRGRFGFASANFYASFLAALEAEKNAKKYFGEIKREKALDYKVLKLSKPINKDVLLKWFDGDEEVAKKYNPHIRVYFWRGRLLPKQHHVVLPTSKYEIAVKDLRELKTIKSTSGHMEYIIGRGDTLSEIAINFGVSLRELKDINGISNPRRIRFGQKIIIPK